MLNVRAVWAACVVHAVTPSVVFSFSVRSYLWRVAPNTNMSRDDLFPKAQPKTCGNGWLEEYESSRPAAAGAAAPKGGRAAAEAAAVAAVATAKAIAPGANDLCAGAWTNFFLFSFCQRRRGWKTQTRDGLLYSPVRMQQLLQAREMCCICHVHMFCLFAFTRSPLCLQSRAAIRGSEKLLPTHWPSLYTVSFPDISCYRHWLQLAIVGYHQPLLAIPSRLCAHLPSTD